MNGFWTGVLATCALFGVIAWLNRHARDQWQRDRCDHNQDEFDHRVKRCEDRLTRLECKVCGTVKELECGEPHH